MSISLSSVAASPVKLWIERRTFYSNVPFLMCTVSRVIVALNFTVA